MFFFFETRGNRYKPELWIKCYDLIWRLLPWTCAKFGRRKSCLWSQNSQHLEPGRCALSRFHKHQEADMEKCPLYSFFHIFLCQFRVGRRGLKIIVVQRNIGLCAGFCTQSCQYMTDSLIIFNVVIVFICSEWSAAAFGIQSSEVSAQGAHWAQE